MKTITCLVNDNYPGTPNPLIYTVEVADPSNHDEVLAAVTEERRADLGDEDGDEIDLTLLMAFDGNPAQVADWRE